MPAKPGTLATAATWVTLVALLVLANLFGNASPYIYLLVLLAAWPFLLANKTSRDVMNRWESYAYIVAFGSILIAFVFAAGGWEHFENVGNFLPFLLFIPAIGLFDKSARRNGMVIIAILALTGSIIAAGVAAHDVYVSGLRRAVGWINTTNPFAVMSVMLGFLALAGFWNLEDRRRYIFFLGPIAGVIATVLAGTRSVFLLAMALSAIFVIFVAAKLSFKGRLVLGAAAIIAAAAAIATALGVDANIRAFGAIESVYLFLTEGQAIDRSVAIRLELFRGGILAFLDAPIFGHGWRHHVEAARPYMTDPTIAEHVEGWSHLHNDYINFAALAGLFGLASYFIYLLVPVISTWRSVRDSQYHGRLYGSFVVSTCYLVYGLFGSAFAAELLLCFGPVFTAVLVGYCKDRPASAPTSSPSGAEWLTLRAHGAMPPDRT